MKPKTKQLSAADVCSMACDMRRQGWPVSVWDEMHENKTAQQWRQLYHRLLADIQTGSEAYIRQTDRQRGIYQTDRQTDRQTYSSAVCVCVCVRACGRCPRWSMARRSEKMLWVTNLSITGKCTDQRHTAQHESTSSWQTAGLLLWQSEQTYNKQSQKPRK